MRCKRMLGRNPWMNITFSAHHLFLYIWKHFGLWEFHNKIHVLPREKKMSLCSHFSLCQLRHRKSEAGKMGREKTKGRGGFRKGRNAEDASTSEHGGRRRQRPLPKAGPLQASPWLQIPWSKPFSKVPSTHPSWLSSHKSTRTPSSLPAHSFFLPSSLHRKSCMVQIPAFVLRLC